MAQLMMVNVPPPTETPLLPGSSLVYLKTIECGA